MIASDSGSVPIDRNTGLDLLRALAIVLTFLVHFLWIIGAWVYQRDFEALSMADAQGVEEAVLIWLYHSQHGVFLFFVVSGFLMGKKWFSATPPELGKFLRDRAWRTLPGAWLAVTVALALLHASGKVPAEPFRLWAENLFFLNWFRKSDTEHLLVVTWSLQAEWLFYLSLPVVAWLAQRSALPRWLTVSLTTIALCAVIKFTSLRGAAYVLFFAVGVLAAIEQTRLRAVVDRTPWLLVLALYTIANAVYAWYSPTAARLQTALWNPFDSHAVVFAITATLLLLKSADADFPNHAWVRVGRYVGKISYSIYLWHFLVLIGLGQWLGWPTKLAASPGISDILIYSLVSIFATWLVSALSFRFIEQPYFHRRANRRNAAAS